MPTVGRLVCESIRHAGVPARRKHGRRSAHGSVQGSPACLSGVVLVAPAVWGWQTMPLLQQAALWSRHIPPRGLTGEGLDIRPSDNVEMLRALGRDPLVIKETRIDAIYGLTNLMEAALRTVGSCPADAATLR